ncbi:MAG: hypothetical protein JWP12_20 [Bacteroidetes bacterium]|nr:hypothetical protein [Bacteroidota bacterium]
MPRVLFKQKKSVKHEQGCGNNGFGDFGFCKNK